MLKATTGRWYANGLRVEDGRGRKVGNSDAIDSGVPIEECIANAHLMAAAPDMAAALEGFTLAGFCPSCGCDLWNTEGCSYCKRMRVAYDALVKAGLAKPREYPPFLEADELNLRNMAFARRKRQ